ncbi:beta-N-acetylhexosaminidase [Flavihumibacter rivuli]|uniref:beta-N-acetylhexosaminidase n=1 Tax=Flavihumibacter rivuli TaxID=2838156 RepID=UPI001BDED0DF|nr:beta-N-acetylhexosaminidase [Flavihumibacter rivuli]ULQ57717.1 beta-N-acetylhexosaminidase [Flavihumibacter rivuli]
MKRICIILSFFLLTSGSTFSQEQFSIIPKPVSLKPVKGKPVTISAASTVYYEPSWKDQANYFRDQVKFQTGLELALIPLNGDQSKAPKHAILLRKDSSKINRPEMYILDAGHQQVELTARDIRGIINGMQSFFQLLPIGPQKELRVPAVVIEDYPRFAYRGMHLDVVRHIFPLDYVKKYIDYLTFHKFNTFHWHLTDDQGWRMEVLSYPRLNSIGSWRDSTLIGHFKDSPARYDGKRYGGYYTRAEIKDVLAYAAVRGINVIPEIDIPGHSRATIAAYPELSTKPDTTWNVATTWGMYNRQNNVLAPKEQTFTFLKAIFTELAELFPSTYIHIGGDECSKLWWKADTATQRFMKEKGLANEVALQTYFIEQVAGYLKQLNRRAVGWHEIAEGDLDTSTLIMNWGDEKQAVMAARKGFDIIMTPGKPYYFDHYQSKDPKDSLAIHGYNPLEAVYQYDPIPATLKKEKLAHKVIGGQANVWTEYMENQYKVDYMVFPRMSAVSESLWTSLEQKNYKDFLQRLEKSIIPKYQSWNSSWFRNYKQWGMDK